MPATFRRVGATVAALLLAALIVGVYLAGNGGGRDAPTAPATQATATAAASSTARTTPTARPGTSATGTSGLRTVRRSELPAEAQATLALIAEGGPFPYERDGVVFENREGILPKKATGYYHEYTVETPGSDDRGARRIVTGKSGELFYTDDHYVSFREVVR